MANELSVVAAVVISEDVELRMQLWCPKEDDGSIASEELERSERNKENCGLRRESRTMKEVARDLDR
jgi:hypothetical protein